MTTEERSWLERTSTGAADDAGAVLRAWRDAADGTQVDVAAMLGTSQQHLSQMEKGQRPISLEQRRLMVTELGIAPEDLGLSSEHCRVWCRGTTRARRLRRVGCAGVASGGGSISTGRSWRSWRCSCTRPTVGFRALP